MFPHLNARSANFSTICRNPPDDISQWEILMSFTVKYHCIPHRSKEKWKFVPNSRVRFVTILYGHFLLSNLYLEVLIRVPDRQAVHIPYLELSDRIINSKLSEMPDCQIARQPHTEQTKPSSSSCKNLSEKCCQVFVDHCSLWRYFPLAFWAVAISWQYWLFPFSIPMELQFHRFERNRRPVWIGNRTN